jgi:hypothetical protein
VLSATESPAIFCNYFSVKRYLLLYSTVFLCVCVFTYDICMLLLAIAYLVFSAFGNILSSATVYRT